MQTLTGIFFTFTILFIPALAHAGDAATVIFKSGQVVKITDGYRQVIDAAKGIRTGQSATSAATFLELNTGGGSVMLNMAEVVVICRDSCSSVQILHQLDPRRAKQGAEIEQ